MYKTPSFDEVATTMKITAYSQLGESTDWALKQGKAIAPHLSRLLLSASADRKRAAESGEPLIGYPFNILWALGQIGGPEARAALVRHANRGQDPDSRQSARLALAGLDLRAKLRRRDVGVLRYEIAPFLVKPSQQGQKIKVLRAGQSFRVLKEHIENEQETGPRGGPTFFCEIELIPGKQRGFLEIEGEGFAPWY